MHSGSEHTIDGQRFDLEMHTVHLPKTTDPQGFLAAALGIIFDTENYDKSVSDDTRKIIDDFFDSLMLNDQTDPQSPEVKYGQLIDALDTDNRWVYKGSVTTPPCGKIVYWNVLAKVYPVSKRHFWWYKDQLAKRPSKTYANKFVDYTGNYREIQEYNGHDLKLLKTTPVKEAPLTSFKSSDVSLLLLVLLFMVIAGMLCVIYTQRRDANYSNKMKGGVV